MDNRKVSIKIPPEIELLKLRKKTELDSLNSQLKPDFMGKVRQKDVIKYINNLVSYWQQVEGMFKEHINQLLKEKDSLRAKVIESSKKQQNNNTTVDYSKINYMESKKTNDLKTKITELTNKLSFDSKQRTIDEKYNNSIKEYITDLIVNIDSAIIIKNDDSTTQLLSILEKCINNIMDNSSMIKLDNEKHVSRNDVLKKYTENQNNIINNMTIQTDEIISTNKNLLSKLNEQKKGIKKEKEIRNHIENKYDDTNSKLSLSIAELSVLKRDYEITKKALEDDRVVISRFLESYGYINDIKDKIYDLQYLIDNCSMNLDDGMKCNNLNKSVTISTDINGQSIL